jgi:hypothetical protein
MIVMDAPPDSAALAQYGDRIRYAHRPTAKPMSLFLGGDHWLKESGEELAVGSEAESLFIEILTRVAAPSAGERKRNSSLTPGECARQVVDMVASRRKRILERDRPSNR